MTLKRHPPTLYGKLLECPEITVSAFVHDTAMAYFEVVSEEHRGDSWTMHIDAQTFKRLNEERYPNESDDECLARLASQGDLVAILQPRFRRFQMTLREAMDHGVVPIAQIKGRGARNSRRDPYNQLWWTEVSFETARKIENQRKALIREETKRFDEKHLSKEPPNELSRPIGEALAKALKLYIDTKQILNPTWTARVMLQEASLLTGRVHRKHTAALTAIEEWLKKKPERKKLF